MTDEVQDKRFRVAKGKMMVVPPDGEAAMKDVVLVYDKTDDSLGIQMLDSQLKGYLFKVARSSFRATMEKGNPTNEIVKV